MSDFRTIARASWDDSGSSTIEKINAGSLQRIADATEKMAASYDALRIDRDYWRDKSVRQAAEISALKHSIRSLRGAITRLKRASGERGTP